MKVTPRHAAPQSVRAQPAPRPAKRKLADFFSREHLRAMPRKLCHPHEKKTNPQLMSAGDAAAVGGATCLAVICSPFIFIGSLLSVIVCCPCITAAACCADDRTIITE